MTNKKRLITELYEETITNISSNPSEWMSFLKTASMNFKYPFNDQVLIYAQRPDATACAKIDTWNGIGRWVKGGSKGIALIEETSGELSLNYVFDVYDTRSVTGKTFRLWSVPKVYEKDIIETLENKFGTLDDNGDLPNAIKSVARILVEDNFIDYKEELMLYRNNSNIGNIDEIELDKILLNLVSNTVAYEMMNRCGIEPNNYFTEENFKNISIFNTLETLSAIGLSSSAISKMGLLEINNTIKKLRNIEINKIRTFANQHEIEYDTNDNINNVERRDNYGDDLFQIRGLRNSEFNTTKEKTSERSGEIFNNEVELSESKQENIVHETIGGRSSNRPLDRDTSPSTKTSGNDSISNETSREYNRRIERERPNEVGRYDEQLEDDGRGDSNKRTNLQLDIYKKDDKSGPSYIVTDDKINLILSTTPFLNKSNNEIINYFDDEKNNEKRIDYLKSIFNNDYIEIMLDSIRYGYKAFDNGILFWKGNYLTRNAEIFVEWNDIIDHYESMILLNQLNNRVKPLKSVSEQLSILDYEVNSEKIGLEFSQEFIDKVLQGGLNTFASKYSIYEFFNKSLSIKENANYLKELFGVGGATHTVSGSGVSEDHNSKGLTLSVGDNEITLSWNKVAKRIKELIHNDRYLSTKELEKYPEWLEKEYQNREKNTWYDIEENIDENSLTYRLNEFLKEYDYQSYINSYDEEINAIESIERQLNNPIELKTIIEYLENINTELTEGDIEKETVQQLLSELNDIFPNYKYKVGDRVYIGIDEYEILELNDEFVKLYDFNAPLFNQEYTRVDFDNKIKENPANDHLLIYEQLEDDNFYNEYNDVVEINPMDIPTETKEEIIIPNFEKKSTNKVSTFDIHPEIKNSERNQFIITNDELGVGTAKEKFQNNMNAIKVLKRCESENRFATTEEQEILSKYVGWGGLSDVFDLSKNNWYNEYTELKNILTENEYEQARASTVTAFYTPPIVIKSMYNALENMGLKTGNILEPSCGIGNFIGMLPNSLSNCKLYGVELDSISGRIARQLYQKSSIAIQGFEETNLPDSFFDVAIGNVPFAEVSVYDKKYDKHNFLIHDYFFAKTLDKIRPGGVVAFITSKRTLDKSNPSVRKYIAQRADLLGAIRLPNNTFEANAGTKVTSDIIFLQKRDSITDLEPEWVHLGKDDNGITMNNYFVEHPEMILGNMEMISTRFGYDSACIAKDNESLSEQLQDAILNINAEVKEYDIEEIEDDIDLSIPADINVKNYSYTLVDGKIYFRENSRMYPQDLPTTTENRIKGLIEIRDCVRTLIEYQTEDYPDEYIKEQQDILNRLYDSFYKKYGLINSRGNNSAFSNDSSYYLLCSLEVLDEKGNLERKADMFSKRTIKAKKEIESVDNAHDALLVSISEKGRVDLSFIQKLCGLDMDQIISDLEGEIFNAVDLVDSNIWVTADEYLSGNIREKLKIAELYAKEDPRLDINVKYLKQFIPKDLDASEISVRLGSTWIPAEYIEDFIDYLLEPSYNAFRNIHVHYVESTSQWNVEGKNYDKGNVRAYSTFGTSRANAYKIIEDTLNLKDTRVYDYYDDEFGKRQAELNKKETAIAQAKQEQIKLKFEEWIWSDPDRRDRLCKIYNERFNSIRPREYDGSHIKFDGINPEITLRKHQVNAIARILYGGNTLLAHEVGAGKTFEMVAAAMESKRLGLCNKSLFVVPNHIVEQFGQEFLQLYPSANILVTTKKDFQTSNRKKFCSRIATGDYDAVIISHSQFEKIPMSKERQIEMIKREINDIVLGISDLRQNNAQRFSIKQLEKTKKKLEVKLKKLNDDSRKDDVITFEELGIDRLFVDEAHYYKNLYLYTKMRNVGGIAQTEAQKSSDLFMKCRYLDEITDSSGVIFATGTPISNSMVELYTMQRYLQYNELEKRGLQQFDSWASTFGETTTAIELSPEGTGYRAKTRFAKFFNLPELMSMFKEVADIQTADMLKLPVPKANYHNVVVQPSELQKELVQELSERADKVRNKQVESYEDNMLKITNDGRKLALDQRLINEMLPDYSKSKVVTCANNIYKIWDENSNNKLAQLVFCDLSTPNKDGKFSVYDDLKSKLIEKGIPEEEIEFIHNANTDLKKQELFNKVRKGQVRVLMGSTQKMGAGTNCQDRLIALHDLDCPWRPSDLIQRSGRIIRQGNINEEVDIYRYVTEGTFDAYLYQLVENKQRFISQIMTSKTPVRYAEDIDETALSYAEIKALAAGNPLILEKTELDTQVAKLKLLKQTYLSQRYQMEDKVIKYYPTEIKVIENRIRDIKDDVKQLKANTLNDKVFEMIVDGITYTDKTTAGEKIIDNFKSINRVTKKEIGEYRGFKMNLSFNILEKTFHLELKNKSSYTVELGDDPNGNIIRINNELDRIESRLTASEESLKEVKRQCENAKKELDVPFEHEEELNKKTKRLNELNALLNLNEKDKEIIEDDSKIEVCTSFEKSYAR